MGCRSCTSQTPPGQSWARSRDEAADPGNGRRSRQRIRALAQAHPTRRVLADHGDNSALGRPVRGDRAALPQGRQRPPAHWSGAHAAHPFHQHWFNLADLACEEALYDSASLRRFVGIDLGRERVPDATTLLKFRKLLNEHKLGEALFAKVGQQLQERGFKVNTGTIVDATIIAAPSSTKNADKARDPEMHQTRKGQQWYFGMKLHIGVDSQSGLAHSAVVTAANVHDKHPLPDLLHGNEQRVYGDSAYASQKALIGARPPRPRLHQPAHPPCRRGGRSSAGQEPQQVAHPLAGGACLWRGQAPVGIWQGALPRAAEERHAGVHGLGAGQHLPWPTTLMAQVRP
jgi:IS5 family transposase